MSESSLNKGYVKQVLSADTIVIWGQPRGGPPPERTLYLSNINGPKLGRRANPNVEGSSDTKDEPFAFAAREFLRKKLIGKEVCFTVEYTIPASGRDYGCLYLGSDESGENVTESLLAAGLVETRKTGFKQSEVLQKLTAIEDIAKAGRVGNWGTPDADSVRDIKWTVENPRMLVEQMKKQKINAVVEFVRDGSTVRVLLLPSCHSVLLMLSGVKCPTVKSDSAGDGSPEETIAAQAKYFTESRLLQRDVEVILEGVSNQNFIGSIIHPKGNVAELLLNEGLARCVDWSMSMATGGAETLRASEKRAKQEKKRLWLNYVISTDAQHAEKSQYVGKVVEIVNGDSFIAKTSEGEFRKVTLSSIIPPRSKDGGQPFKDGRRSRILYDIPYMFEAREYLRQKLVGKKVNVSVDYVRPAVDNFPERTCATVMFGNINVAEALISKGFATVVRHRSDDDQRSSHYDNLLRAEDRAINQGKGLHSKTEPPIHRVADISGELNKAKQFLPFLQRAKRCEAIVEYVFSGSRLKLFIPRETCLITFLLSGISCPRGSRLLPNGQSSEGEAYSNEAMMCTKEYCMQREVHVEVEAMDKAGNFIGWLFVDDKNLSLTLVEQGLSSVHFTADRSMYAPTLYRAQDEAKTKQINIWKDYVEPEEPEFGNHVADADRKICYQRILVTEINELRFFAQLVENGNVLESLMQQLHSEFDRNPPLIASYKPRKNELCAARYIDSCWYRAKIEKIQGNQFHVFYIDYGNKEIVTPGNIAQLPQMFHTLAGQAKEYTLACVSLPADEEMRVEVIEAFRHDVQNNQYLMNIEYKVNGAEHCTLADPDTKNDVALGLVEEGFLLLENRNDQKLRQLIGEYSAAQEIAKKKRINVWRYGDITPDDADEFGFQKR